MSSAWKDKNVKVNVNIGLIRLIIVFKISSILRKSKKFNGENFSGNTTSSLCDNLLDLNNY